METKKCKECGVRYKVSDKHECDPRILFDNRLKERNKKKEIKYEGKFVSISDMIGHKIVNVNFDSIEYLAINLDNGKIVLIELVNDESYYYLQETFYPSLNDNALYKIGFYTKEEFDNINKENEKFKKLSEEIKDKLEYERLKAKYGK